MRILVCGGRNFTDYIAVCEALDSIRDDTPLVIIEGGAKGADTLAYKYGKVYGQLETYHAKWDEHGKGAGPIRNQQMLDEGKPDIVVAFPDKENRGTWDMVRRAKRAGVKTLVYPNDF